MALPEEVLEHLCNNLLEYKIAKGWDYGEFSGELDENETIDEVKNRVRTLFSDRGIQVVVTGDRLYEQDDPMYYIRVMFV